MEAVRRKLPLNPKEKANFFSLIFFWWTIDTFKTGYRKVLQLEDVYQTMTADKSENVGNRLDNYWTKYTKNTKKRPSLLKGIIYTFWPEYTALTVIVTLNELVFRLSQPYLLGKLLLFFREDSNMSFQEAMCYATGITICNTLTGIFFSQFNVLATIAGTRVRTSVCSMIYRKTLRLSQTALGKTAFGKIVNLLSNDVIRFEYAIFFINYLWIAPVMCLIVGYLIFLEVRWAGLIGLSVICIVVPLQSYTGILTSKFRMATALRTDERVRFMDEIICGVQVIKMYAWEKSFAKLISVARKLELKVIRKNAYVRGLHTTFSLFTNRIGILCTMLSIVLLYGQDQLVASKVFPIAGYFAIITLSLSQFFVRAVGEIAEILVVIRRFQNFMDYEEKQEKGYEYKLNNPELKSGSFEDSTLRRSEIHLLDNLAVSMKYVTARWIPLSKKVGTIDYHTNTAKVYDWKPATLENINIDIKKGSLIGIVGPVGAGKSSLLQALLRELPLESGSISVCGTFSYAAQIPWIFGSSVRQNILFGEEMNRQRFDTVIEACDLKKDFEEFTNGDLTIIGEKGITLSGGQKARVNLARAVYKKADIYILDDPLSAVDTHVGQHLFNECISSKGSLGRQGATRILVTHQVHFLKEADLIIVLRDGKMEAQGSPNELSSIGVDTAALLGSCELDESKSVVRKSRVESLTSNSTTLIKEDKLHDSEKYSKECVQELEASSKGRVNGSVGLAYLQSGGNCFMLFFVFTLFLITQALGSGADYWVSYWISKEELKTYYTGSSENNYDVNSNNTNYATLYEDFGSDIAERNTSKDADNIVDLFTTQMCFYIHASLIVLLFIVSLLRSFTFFTTCIRASQNLHDLMFKGIISTSMRFFDTNPSGRILNRFSKDMGAADDHLPRVTLDAAQIILNTVGAILITSVVNPLFIIPVIALGAVYIYVQKIVLKTSKDLQRLEGISRSPVFTHIGASLDGISTIRAVNAQKILIDEFDNHQDLHSSCWHLFNNIGFAFGLSLDLMCAIFICILMFSFLLMKKTLGSEVGLAITQIMSLTSMLQWGIRQSTEVVNLLMSVERILEYRDLTPEIEPKKPQILPKTWPFNGQIEFRNVVYRYFSEAEPVLQGLKFIIKPKEKIGIVGRTGAGKSSLVGAIFRMGFIEGNIVIDDVDVASISLRELRSAISIIPQDPIFFSGTLRRNLDLFEQYKDNDIWRALEEVELKDIASGLLGLETFIMAGGSNLSVGQRQLLCLARAILRNNKILILDEATANVDPHTDNLIQHTIRRKFAECTVLTVAHRLNIIMDSDRVLVMDAGKAIEFGIPFKLLNKPNGVFRKMVENLGTQETDRLTKIAESKFQSEQNNI